MRIAKDLGVAPSQVALSWIAHRAGVTAPIVGARTRKHLADNLGAVDLILDARATMKLDEVSAPRPINGYPYGAFGAWQRARPMDTGSSAKTLPFSGSDRPTGTG